ncbi:MAG TPA: TonB-dependent receptor [Steroidobacteraceae bacterium]|nr:TonB-dependent receptor [Steroidobacteraceae bacterium]
MPDFRKRNPLIAAAIATALAGTRLAHAADADAAPTASTPAPVLQEVVVTANRREEDVLTVPYNISAISAAQIQDAGVKDLEGLTRMVPGLVAADLGPRVNSTNSTLIIRGLNASDEGSNYFGPNLAVPLVSTYLDDVPLFVNFNLTDIERVEVLRGPQGTLYGSGAVGGTVKLLRHKPDLGVFSVDFTADTSGTEHSQGPSYSFSGIVNVPVSDTVALRASAGMTKITGFIDASHVARFQPNGQPLLADPSAPLTSDYQYTTKKDVDSATSEYGRLSMLWKPSEVLSVLFDYTHQEDHSGGFSAETVNFNYATGAPIPIQPYTTTTPLPEQSLNRLLDIGALTVTADFGFATLTSSTSYYDNRYNDVIDVSSTQQYFSLANPYYYGGYPRFAAFNFDYSKDESLVEELRLVSKTGGAWDYIVGAFFRTQKEALSDPEIWPGLASWSHLPGSANAYNYYAGTTFNTFADVIASRDGSDPESLKPTDLFYNNIRHTRFKDRALYGELTRHLTDRWQVTGGAREFWQAYDQVETQIFPFAGAFYSDTGTDPLGDTTSEQAKSYRNHIFKLNTSYEISPAARVYATWSEGFRHGGANSFKICPSGAPPLGGCEPAESAALIPYVPDTAKNYEVGIKGEIGGRVRYSTSLYRVDWHNIQLDAFAPVTGIQIVANGKDARSQGVELEVQALVTTGLSATIGGSLTDAHLTDSFVTANFIGQKGNALPLVPRTQLTAALDYVFLLPQERDVSFHMDAAYRSAVDTSVNDLQVDANGNTFVDIYATNFRRLSGFTTLNAGIGFQASKQVKLRLYCNNITDQKGVTTWSVAHQPEQSFEYVMRPRTAGIELDYSFR